MFTSLSQFYTSQAWRDFRRLLIAERTNKEDGFLYDEHDGKPLLRSYDIVLHHKIPLTMANVNDVKVSLNPDNVMIVSQRSHNEIHARFGYCAQRKVYLVYGSPCAGKTTFVESAKGNSDLIVDIDRIWMALTGGTKYEKPDALKAVVFAIRDKLLDLVKVRAGKWERAWIIDGASSKADRDRKIALYNAEPVFIDTDIHECKRRLYADGDATIEQREAWERYIDDWFENYERDKSNADL